MVDTVILAEAIVFPTEVIVAFFLVAASIVVVTAIVSWTLGVSVSRRSRTGIVGLVLAGGLWVVLVAAEPAVLLTAWPWPPVAVFVAGYAWGRHRLRRAPTPPPPPPPPSSPPGPRWEPPSGPPPR